MGNLKLFRAFAVLILVAIGGIQIHLCIDSMKIMHKNKKSDFLSMNDMSSTNTIKLPITKQQYPEKLIEWAERYLKLPVWSKGYHHCYSKESEVSCFELYRAAKIIEHWNNHSINNKTQGLIFVNITNEPFFDRLSMLYHGFQIAISSNRALYVEKKAFLPIQLPDSIKDIRKTKAHDNDVGIFCEDCFDIPIDKIECLEIDSRKYPNITFHGASYPQILYNHHLIGSYLYENFGFHSAHFIGNFLYGSYVKPQIKNNFDAKLKISIEGWKFSNEKRFSLPSEINSFISKCSHNQDLFLSQIKENSVLITNDILNETESNKYAKVFSVIPNDSESFESYLNGIYTLISNEWIIYTFGSRMGFWASALLGSKSSILNTYDKTCINLSFSQQGSLFHTESPPDLREVFRINTYFHPCGTNNVEAKRYLENLLW